MSFLNRIFSRNKDKGERVGGIEDYMMLIRVYYQSTMAAHLGISNLAAVPDLRVFKQTYKVPTLNNKLGVGEKKHCKRLIHDIYGTPDTFFSEIDSSIKKHCRKLQDAQTYLVTFQGFSQDLMMLMGNLMQWKFRLPGFLSKAMKQMVAKQIHDILTKTEWKDEGVRRACVSLRKYQAMLGYSEEWMTEYVHTFVMLAKKEPKKNTDE